MRYVFTGLLFFIGITTLAQQPVLLTEDPNPNKTTDGYEQGFLVDAPKSLDGTVYFSTPNFRLYESDGTAAGTKMLVQFPVGSLVYIKAVTKQFVYFTIRRYAQDELQRLNRKTLKQEVLTRQQKPLALVVSYSAVFRSVSKDLLAVRTWDINQGITRLEAFADDGPAEAKLVVAGLKSDKSATINNFSAIGFVRSQLFFNGHETKELEGKSAFEYTILSFVPATKADGLDYELKNVYSLRSKGYEINDGFYTVGDSLLTIGFVRNQQTGTRDLFVGSLHWATFRIEAAMETDQNFAWGEVVDDQLYLINGNRLLRWLPGRESLDEVFRKRTYQYQRMHPDRRLLKCGNFLVVREEDSLRTFNMITKTFAHVGMTENYVPQNSLYKKMDHVAWTTDKHIYYTSYRGLEMSLIQYDPLTGQRTPVVFPQLDKERFASILTIFQSEGKFFFMTKYIGKKDKPVYKIFTM